MTDKKVDYRQLRSARWFAPEDKLGHIHRERIKQAGYTDEDFAGKPVIAVFSTWSELNPCHIHFRERAADVKRGIWQAGGFPLEVPCMSLGEPFMKPTTMLYRDLLAMEVEENLRAHPIDGVVLMGGCDKTTPAMLMGAVSANLPAIYMPAGPMLNAVWRGERVGSGTDTAKWHDALKAGRITKGDFRDLESAGARSAGTCMTMGTASTMTLLAEVMGMTLPGAAAIPAADSRHRHMASATGRRAVELVWQDIRPREVVDEKALFNAIVTLMALGGSTNAVIHLVALADRLGIDLTLDSFDRASRDVPVLANLRPSGEHLMEDFFFAGGLPALLAQIADKLKTEHVGVSGQPLALAIDGAERFGDDVIRDRENPVSENGGIAILRGSLAPDGCVIKQSAASPELQKHQGRGLVFDSREEMFAKIDDPDLDVDASTVLVLRNIGLVGAPGMPEWGMMPIPQKLLKKGVVDMVRISDARMSGTHFGTAILHVTPEAAVKGPIGLVESGDLISLDVENRRLDLLVDPATLEARAKARAAFMPTSDRGWPALYVREVSSPSDGAIVKTLGGSGIQPDPAPGIANSIPQNKGDDDAEAR